MAIPTEQSDIVCAHCDKAIPGSNIDLHFVHCSRNLERCKDCGKMVPKRHAEEHFLDTHAPQVACLSCGEMVRREISALHRNEQCPQRIVSCEYCKFLMPAEDLFEHREMCGTWRECCHLCGRYIRRRERTSHWTRCPAISSGSFSDDNSTEGQQDAHRGQRRHDLSHKRLLFAIAIAGVSVLLNVLGTYVLLQVKK